MNDAIAMSAAGKPARHRSHSETGFAPLFILAASFPSPRDLSMTMPAPSFLKSLVLCLVITATQALAQQPARFPTISLTAGMHVIKAEVAAKDAERQQGLMFREKLGPNEGMVFLFDAPASVCMWMKNTLIPLSVAFLDDSGRIVNIEDMQPQSTDSHCAKKPIRYALEMDQGWFKQKNIKPGSRIEGLPPVR